MTITEAEEVASTYAYRKGKAHVIFRFQAWPPDVWAVVSEDRGLPREAVIHTVVRPATSPKQEDLF